MKLCEADAKKLAKENPDKLINIIEAGEFESEKLTNGAIAVYADNLRFAKASDRVINCLLKLFEHESVVVREGAIYGIAKNISNIKVRNAIVKLIKNDKSNTIREIAREALVDYEEGS